MKTCMFTTCWLNGSDAQGSNRLERTKRYLNYYRKLKAQLGFEKFVFADNTSDIDLIEQILAPDVHLHRYDSGLYRGPLDNDYPYCWRGIYFLKEIITELGFDKIIVCDTDAFILSERMVNYVREKDSGYTTFWSEKYQFPLAEICIVCKDAFPQLLEWMNEKTWKERSDTRVLFESAYPHYQINKDFKGDRYGEMGQEPDPSIDFFTQARLENKIELMF